MQGGGDDLDVEQGHVPLAIGGAAVGPAEEKPSYDCFLERHRAGDGASSVGAVYADRLAKRGYDLILVARNQDRLARLAQRLRTGAGRAVETIAADLGDKEDRARVETRLRTDPRITLLVNNAGAGATQPLLEADVEKVDAMIQLNVGALTRLTYAVAPGFVARGDGTIINIASIVAISPERLNGVYGGTKAFVWPSARAA